MEVTVPRRKVWRLSAQTPNREQLWSRIWINYFLSGRSLKWGTEWLTCVCVGVKWRWLKSQRLPLTHQSKSWSSWRFYIQHASFCYEQTWLLRDLLHAFVCVINVVHYPPPPLPAPPKQKHCTHSCASLCTRLNLLPLHEPFLHRKAFPSCELEIFVFFAVM